MVLPTRYHSKLIMMAIHEHNYRQSCFLRHTTCTTEYTECTQRLVQLFIHPLSTFGYLVNFSKNNSNK